MSLMQFPEMMKRYAAGLLKGAVRPAALLMMAVAGLLASCPAAFSQAASDLPAGTKAQALTPEQRQAVERLTPEQRQRLQAEVARTGKPSPETVGTQRSGQQAAETSAARTVQDALKVRASAEQDVRSFEQKISLGQQKRYGFDLFTASRRRILYLEDALSKGELPPALSKDAISSFVGPLDMLSAAVNASVPLRYALSPGDEITLYYWGDLIELTTVKLKLDAGGEVAIPQAGKIVARGMSLPQFQKAVQDHLQRVMSKTVKLVAALDRLQSIQIAITGEAFRPGNYAVSSITTLFNALHACGGASERGSLRNIKLLRGNKTITVDFYDYLMRGDDRADLALQAGDTIFIGMTGKLAAITGEVMRPAVYELKKEETLKDLLSMAHGIRPSGLTSKVQIQSVVPHRERVVVDVDLSRNAPTADREIQDGDIVTVEPIVPGISRVVTLEGAVTLPGVYELKKDMRIGDLFTGDNVLKGDAHRERVDIIRLDRDGRTTTAIPVDLNKALTNDVQSNIALEPLDRIVVYSKWDIKYYPARIVSIQGSVNRPGSYPRTEGMRMRDLLLMAGGLVPGSLKEVQVAKARYHAELKPISVNMDLLEQGDESQNLLLDDEDVVLVRTEADYFNRPQWVTIGGEVKYPGSYPLLRKDYRLSDLLQQAGGLTRMANAKGTVFLRKRENLPSAEQKVDVVSTDSIVNVLNKLDFERQAAKNMLLLKKDLANAGVPDTAPPAVGLGGSRTFTAVRLRRNRWLWPWHRRSRVRQGRPPGCS